METKDKSSNCVIDETSARRLRVWFDDYIDTFDMQDKELSINIALKREHTLRVCNEIAYIGKNLGLSETDLVIAEVLALFHDIGRFEQYRKYRTFVDSISVNHAEFGIEILRENSVLTTLDSSTAEFILKVISYHNRAYLPDGETPACLFFSRLLRDADKLDIWYVLTSYYSRSSEEKNRAIELDLPDTPGISPGVYKGIMSHSVINHSLVRSLNDFKMLQAAWVFDVNFQPTFQRLYEKGYLDMIRDSIAESKEIDDIFSMLRSCLEERIFLGNVSGLL
ncbi:MAG: HD domain-containing protein [Deltaproteobacteria bacterium]|nr:HD domain-containing protein [Deltaproteobacteria bacterium]